MGEFFTLKSGGRLYVDDAGQGPAVVCLHGLGGGGHFFSGLAPALSPRFSILCPDMPGSGFSPRPSTGLPLTFDFFADIIRSLILQHTTGPVTLLGHSMGVITALQIRALLPERVTRMVFVSGLPAPREAIKPRLQERADMARHAGMHAVAAAVPPGVFAGQSFRKIPDKIALFARTLAASDAEGYAQTAEALIVADARSILPAVRIPCLCLTGAEDQYAPPETVRDFARALPDASFVELPGCGHMSFYEAPELFCRHVETFLSRSP